jgi:hypothetical protein
MLQLLQWWCGGVVCGVAGFVKSDYSLVALLVELRLSYLVASTPSRALWREFVNTRGEQ